MSIPEYLITLNTYNNYKNIEKLSEREILYHNNIPCRMGAVMDTRKKRAGDIVVEKGIREERVLFDVG